MRIAVPIQNELLNPHFGQSQVFQLFDADEKSGEWTLVSDQSVPGDGGCGVIPGWLHGQGVQVVICGGIGGGAMARLQQAGIRVVHGAPVESPAALVRAWVAGSLATTNGLCDHHHDHHHGHHHDHHSGCGSGAATRTKP